MSHSKRNITRLPLLPVTTRDGTRLWRRCLRAWYERKKRMKERKTQIWKLCCRFSLQMLGFLRRLVPAIVLHVSSRVHCATESTGGAPVSHLRLSPPDCGLSSVTGWQGWGAGPGSLRGVISCSPSSLEGYALKLWFSLRRISFLSLWEQYSTPMHFRPSLFKQGWTLQRQVKEQSGR